TDAGAALLPSARATLAAVERFRDDAAAVKGVLRGTLRIGIMQAFVAVNVPRLLGQFQREHPQVEVAMRPAGGGAAELLRSVAEGELDLAFVAVTDLPRGLRAMPIASERMVLAGDAVKAPADRPVHLRDLTEANWVDFPQGWATRTALDRAFAQLGLRRRVAIEVADVPTLIQLVQEGLGVTVAPPSLFGTAELQTRELRPAMAFDLAVVTRDTPPLTPAAAAFLALLEL
ncbi:MAG TPA: LysR substrate-binding domain-containing protein, partial [Solirubrobacteraceae bacterium]|nr:LysR substrate-binding domain-containing protein [Solirubrobacteraceae bacterium]